jgi:hypothetical protein
MSQPMRALYVALCICLALSLIIGAVAAAVGT